MYIEFDSHNIIGLLLSLFYVLISIFLYQMVDHLLELKSLVIIKLNNQSHSCKMQIFRPRSLILTKLDLNSILSTA